VVTVGTVTTERARRASGVAGEDEAARGPAGSVGRDQHREASEKGEPPVSAAVGQREWDVTVRGTRIRMLGAGSGPPLLYLHGSGDLGLWTPALAGLAETHSVYRPDHPGFGGSADRDGIDSVHELAFFYLDLLNELGVEEIAVVGASLGGWIAADLATIEPRRVSRLVLVDAAGVRADVPTPDTFTFSPAQLAEVLYHDEELRAEAVRQAASVEDDPQRFELFLRNRIATAHLGWNPYMHDPKLPRRLHRITAPTLIMWGGRDRVFPVGYVDRWSELLPKAEVAVIDGAGHLPLVEQPDTALAVLSTFLREEGQ
jgi:pimeloyl-ACP methyl ester carboxylesterase